MPDNNFKSAIGGQERDPKSGAVSSKAAANKEAAGNMAANKAAANKAATDKAASAKAEEYARNFLQNEKEYQMGFLAAEQPNPRTARLSQTFAESTAEGVKMLLSVDMDMAGVLKETLSGKEFDLFYKAILKSLSSGGRLILSGCGSSGRLCMRLEASWRKALKVHSARYNDPASKTFIDNLADRVVTVMTGGDYAVIRSVESFEDYSSLSRAQIGEYNVSDKDIVVGVTATAETTSILGSAMAAAEKGAQVYMLVCTSPESVAGRMKRAKDLYSHPRVSSLYLPINGMAVTGSTRMQSSTIEQAVAACAMQMAMAEILSGAGINIPFLTPVQYSDVLTGLIERMCENAASEQIAAYLDREAELYGKSALITYFSDDYILDILTDTTERSPTFMIPPFKPKNMLEGPQSWAFVKNPLLKTEAAWFDCFMREPRCITWTKAEYVENGLEEEIAGRMRQIDKEALMQFEIGNEPAPERTENNESTAVWVSFNKPCPEFFKHASKYRHTAILKAAVTGSGKEVSEAGKADIIYHIACAVKKTPMDIFEHLAMKLILNTVSTGVMAKMGRISGNWMSWLDMSNKKLVDRSARIVADQCGISYEKALFELFYTKVLLDEEKQKGGEAKFVSPAQLTIQRLAKLCQKADK